jgi:putative membrane-bound dehydrogenase-like protein
MKRALCLAVAGVLCALNVAPAQEQEKRYDGLAPEEAAKAMTVEEGFGVQLVAGEPDVSQPVAMALDDRGRIWVAEAYEYPRRAEKNGKDRIVILEDTNGDAKADKRTVFMEGLNLVSGLEVGFGGVWIGAAPYLMFVPDKNGDDKPDSEPQILLDGWHYEDTHETLNAFNWGPDGWLYGCHGVFTHSRVGKPGTPDEQRIPLNAAVWRYHPTKHVFEIFAEGGSNQWGVDFNDHGQAFMTACVIPHLYHVIQGARYQRQAGKHFNPHVYDDIKHIGDHVHWLGDKGPHAGNDKSDAAGGGHAHCGALVYLGDNFPPEYRNRIFMSNIHGNRVNSDILERRGSGFVGKHGPDLTKSNDKWSRMINFKTGPDGAVYMIDWYDKQACHRNEPEIWDRTNGRVYRVSYNNAKTVQTDVAKMGDAELVKMQLHANDFYVRNARRVLQERAAAGNLSADVRNSLAAIVRENPDVTRQLRAMWALHAVGGLDEGMILAQLDGNKDEYVRAWAIQLACENGKPSPSVMQRMVAMAKDDPSPVVRLYLASALQRVAVPERWAVLENLVAHAEDAKDQNLPLLYWYAAEAAVAQDKNKAVALMGKAKIPVIRQYVAKRLAAR